MRQFFVGGNFKLNPTSLSASKSLIEILNNGNLDPETGMSFWSSRTWRGSDLLHSPSWNIDYQEVVIAPPSIYLIPVSESIRKDVKVAAQNSYSKDSGAFTGEIRWAPSALSSSIFLKKLFLYSPKQLADAGIPYVILGLPSFFLLARFPSFINWP